MKNSLTPAALLATACRVGGGVQTLLIAVVMIGIQVASGAKPIEGVDRFVVLARDDAPGKGHGPTLVLEYRPGDAALVKRTQLASSSWSPGKMFGKFDGFLRHQVNHPRKRPYVTHFLHLDVDTWRVRTLLISDQITGLYCDSDRAYLRTDKGIRVMNRRNLSFGRKPLRFTVVTKLRDRYALIRGKPGAKNSEGELFDFREGKTLAKVKLPEGSLYFSRYELREDAAAMAIFAGSSSGGGLAGWADARLYLYDLKNEERHTIPFKTKVSPGSGAPVIYHTFDMQFVKDGSLVLTDGNPPRYLKVDPVSGNIEDGKKAWVARPRQVNTDAKAIVEFVSEKTDLKMNHNQHFRFATLPGGRFLALTKDAQTFVYGDLASGTVLAVPNPSRSIDVHIYALPAMRVAK